MIVSQNTIELLKNKRNVYTHNDADGVTSAVLLSYLTEIEVSFPDEFGDVNGSEVCLDMKPLNPEYNGIVIDHHLNHPENRKYILIWDYYPTSKIVYNICREFIPKEEIWKVVVGLVGDGQPEEIPVEVWDLFPELLQDYCYSKYSYGNIDYKGYKIFKLLSSGINSLCRINRGDLALKMLKNSKSPLELIYSTQLREAKDMVETECRKVLEKALMLKLGNILFVNIESEYNIHSLIASSMLKDDELCIIVYNSKTGKGSIRGILSTWLANKLKGEIEVGGHAGFMGFTTNKDVLAILKRIL